MTTPEDTPKDPKPRETSPYRVSDRHAAVRRANRSETAEDYVEAIADLQEQMGQARVRDLAEEFGVSHVTVSRTIDRLQRDGLVTSKPYRSIDLTESGRAMAERSKKRHAVVLRFLLALGIPSAAAELDAEGMEHHVGPETLAAFSEYSQSASPPSDCAASLKPDDHRVEPPAANEATASAESTGSTESTTRRFERVREAHGRELAEDYVEAIDDLISERGEARVVDLAHHFGVSHVTVSRALGRLQRDGLVQTQPYRPVHLTPTGRSLATQSRERHQIVLSFLLWLGIPPRAAEIDAEGVEHHVSPVTLQAFLKLSGYRAPTDG